MLLIPHISHTLRVLSFVAACAVVAIHSNTIFVVEEPARWNLLFHHYFCEWWTSYAVRFFFCASGFFFGLSAFLSSDFSWKSYGKLFKKKVVGLLIPYLSWIAIAVIVTTPVVMAVNWTQHRWLWERTVFDCDGVWKGLVSTFGLCSFGGNGPKPLGVLWFVRDLMLTFLLAPVWHLFRRKSVAWILVVAAVGLIHYCSPSFAQQPYFFFGLALAIYLPKNWILTDKAQSSVKLPRFVSYSFWIYCTHNLFLVYLLAGGHYLLGKTNAAVAVLTPTAWCLAIALSILSATTCEKFFPKVHSVLSGGR